MKKAIIFTGILSALLLISGCMSTATSPPPRGELQVVSHELVRLEDGSAEVLVTIKNTGMATVELARVTVTFLDAEKQLLDTSSDSVLNLNPEETWDFTIICQGERCRQIAGYDIETMAGTSTVTQ